MKRFFLILLFVLIVINGCSIVDEIIPIDITGDTDGIGNPDTTNNPQRNIPSILIPAPIVTAYGGIYGRCIADFHRNRLCENSNVLSQEIYDVPFIYFYWNEIDIEVNYRVYINGIRVITYYWGLWYFFNAVTFKEGIYRITVRAVFNGVESVDSNEFIINLSKPEAPVNLRFIENPEDDEFILHWDEVPNTLYYTLYRNENEIAKIYTETMVDRSGYFYSGYEYTVTSYNSILESEHSEIIRIPE